MKYIILDRDGVINYDSDVYIKSPEEWIPIPGSLNAITKLNQAGFHVIIATNQSGIARGYYDVPTLEAIHQKMRTSLQVMGGAIHDIFYCPHHPVEQCECRKPKPGLLYQIQTKYAISLKETFFIGDSIRDVQAGERAGCQPLLVLTGNGIEALEKLKHKPIDHFKDLAEAVDYVIDHQRK